MRPPGVLAVFALAACAHAGAPPTLAASLSAHDGRAAAAWFAPDADVTIVAGPGVRGRAAIARALDGLFARYADAHVAIGRQWRSGAHRVTEFVITATRAGRPIGIAAAAVEELDADGRIARARLYVDVPTIVGQLDPSKLPDGARTRAPITAPIAGTARVTAAGSATEAANLATARAIWDRLDAHDPAGVLAPSAPGYVYDDLSGPAPLDVDGTRALLERFLEMVPDFVIAETPTLFAAGDDVITESIEHMTFQGRAVVLHGLDVKHLVGGRVTREWQYANGAEVVTALLGLPPLALP